MIDESRGGRIVPVKAYYPGNYKGAPVPVILWSHGLGGSVDGAAFLSRHIAGHGFVVLHIQHPGTDSSLWEGKDGHPWDIIRKTPIPRSATLDRFADVPFVLDRLKDWAARNPAIGDIMDLTRIGMSGHSFGALTTQVMAGQMFPDEKGVLRVFRETRFTAGIVYSPVPIQHLALDDPQDIYGTIRLPLLHMTGTNDVSPLEGFDYKKRLIVHRHAGGGEQYLHILQGGDHMIYNGSRGQLEENPLRAAHEEEIKRVALAFWDAHLKGDEEARNWIATALQRE